MSSGSTFSSKTPHFFKIILDETLQEKRLLIPKKFVRLYGEALSDFVSLKLPCGSQWKMKLMKHEGKVWLGKGWTEFARHYSIIRGHMIVFRYEGNSEFEAFVFNTSTVEIDYPVVSKGDNVETSEDFRACHRAGKRMRTSPLDQPETSSFRAEHNRACPSKTVLENLSETEVSRSFESEMNGKQDSPSRSFDGKSGTTSRKMFKRIWSMKPMHRSEKLAALEKASDFTSDRPFFKVVMQRYYVRGHIMAFPASFAKIYLENKPSNAVLEVPNGRGKTWPVKHSLVEYVGGKSVARLSCGWKEFARDNSLEVGDVCVFVMLKTKMVSFQVLIFRLNGNSTLPNSSAPTRVDHRGKNAMNESETSEDSACDDSLEQEGDRSTPSSNKTSLKPDAIAGKISLTKIQKDRLLKKADFVSERPFFKVVVQPSYANPGCHLPIPLDFAKRFIKNEGDIVLRVRNNESWPVQLKVWSLKTGQVMAGFCSGWVAFAEGNDLEAGDVCVFELVDGTEQISFDVHIVRIPNDDSYHQQCQPIHVLDENGSESYSTSDEETSTPNCRYNFAAKRANQAGKKALALVEKSKLLERARFVSQKPFFKVVMQPSYVASGYHVPVPNDFARKYIRGDRNAILRTPNSTRSWPARCNTRYGKSGNFRAEIYGWKEFAEYNKLEVGDVCVFELTSEANRLLFDVSIVRSAHDDHGYSRCNHGCDSPITTLEPNEDERVIIEVD